MLRGLKRGGEEKMENIMKEESLDSYLVRLQSNNYASDPRDDFSRNKEYMQETGVYDNMTMGIRGFTVTRRQSRQKTVSGKKIRIISVSTFLRKFGMDSEF